MGDLEAWPEDTAPRWVDKTGLCRLVHGKERPCKLVWGEGNPGGRVVVILDNPGAREDRSGVEFVCGTRQTLRSALAMARVPEAEVYTAFLFRCRPAGKYDREAAARAHVPVLERQVSELAPRCLVALGDTVCKALFGPDPLPAIGGRPGRRVSGALPGGQPVITPAPPSDYDCGRRSCAARQGGEKMAVRPILLLGNPALCVTSATLREADLVEKGPLLEDLRDTLLDFMATRGTARAIAAPQIGCPVRVIYIHQPGPSRFLLNPLLEASGPQTLETWENCMSFPDLFVRTRRFSSCSVTYKDERWQARRENARGPLAVLLQHECDHLDGILSVARAADRTSFCLASQQAFIRRGTSGRTGLRPGSIGW